MNVLTVDLGHKLRKRIEFCLALAPIVIGRPIGRKSLGDRELHPLRIVGDELP